MTITVAPIPNAAMIGLASVASVSLQAMAFNVRAAAYPLSAEQRQIAQKVRARFHVINASHQLVSTATPQQTFAPATKIAAIKATFAPIRQKIAVLNAFILRYATLARGGNNRRCGSARRCTSTDRSIARSRDRVRPPRGF
jgi:hypothetical protein